MPEESRPVSCDDNRNELAAKIAELLKAPDAMPLILGAMSTFEIRKKEVGLIPYDGGQTEYLINRFLVAKKVKGCTDNTIRLYRANLRRGFDSIGKTPTQCDHTDIQGMIAKLIIKGRSKAYQQNMQRTFSSFYEYLTREEIIHKNPMLKVDSIKAKAPKKKAFTEMEVEKIRAACRNKRETCLIEVLLSTCCRIFEVAKLTIDECRNSEIQIIGKGEKPRTVYLNARAQLAIQAYLAERKDRNPYLFPISINVGKQVGEARALKGQHMWYTYSSNVAPDGHQDKSSLEATIRAIGKLAGVKECHAHRFRRTSATMALKRGMNVVYVQKMLGHSSLDTTQRYLDISDDELTVAHRKYVI